MARDPIHPGAFLADELAELRINATELAHALHIPPNRVYQILNGKPAMAADTALPLGQWLSVSAELWMNGKHYSQLTLPRFVPTTPYEDASDEADSTRRSRFAGVRRQSRRHRYRPRQPIPLPSRASSRPVRAAIGR
jgi:addiction module HigA family antidote